MQWATEKLIPNLEYPPIIVIDNASYQLGKTIDRRGL